MQYYQKSYHKIAGSIFIKRLPLIMNAMVLAFVMIAFKVE